MNELNRETLFINLEFNLDKAQYIANKIIETYGLDFESTSELEDQIFASKRWEIGIEMEILTDYIKNIRTNYDSIRKAVAL